MRTQFCLSFVLCGSVVAVTAAAVEGPATPAAPPGNPQPRVFVPPRPARPASATPFATNMPIDMVRIVPEAQVLPGRELPPMPGPDLRITAPYARLRTYVTSMPIISHGGAPAPTRPTAPRPQPPQRIPPEETSPLPK
jgi:hypothetical protein